MNRALDYARGISGWMCDNELEWLVRTASSLPAGAVWLEVGTWMGRSWSAVALSLPFRSGIIAVDTFKDGLHDSTIARLLAEQDGTVFPAFMRTYDEVRAMRPDIETRIIMKSSMDGAAQVPDHSCDVIFIDADHRTPEISADLNAWRPKLKAGGLLCGHDAGDAGVDAALKGLPYKCDPSVSGTIWWMK